MANTLSLSLDTSIAVLPDFVTPVRHERGQVLIHKDNLLAVKKNLISPVERGLIWLLWCLAAVKYFLGGLNYTGTSHPRMQNRRIFFNCDSAQIRFTVRCFLYIVEGHHNSIKLG